MGGGGAPGGAPGMAGAKPNIGPVTTPQHNAGTAAAGLSKVRNAITMLEEAIPMIPMGTPIHTELLGMATKLTKLLSGGGAGGEKGIDLRSLLDSARQQSQSSPMAALGRMMPQQGGAPAMPGGAPGGEASGGAPPPAMAA
jgi:hypothetical protein